MTKKTVNRKPIATKKNPNIAAILQGRFRYKTMKQAEKKLKDIREGFVLSSRLPIREEKNNVNLWIRGYGLNEAEEKDGYLGNYANIYIKELADGFFSVRARKLEVKLKYHPEKNRKTQRYPNLWHPVFRNAEQKRIFNNIDDMRWRLDKLHQDYPEVSIPLRNKIYIMVWDKQEGKESPIEKYVVEIKINAEGGFYFDMQLNDYKKKELPEGMEKKPEKKFTSDEAQDSVGFYTSLVDLKRKKKKAA